MNVFFFSRWNVQWVKNEPQSRAEWSHPNVQAVVESVLDLRGSGEILQTVVWEEEHRKGDRDQHRLRVDDAGRKLLQGIVVREGREPEEEPREAESHPDHFLLHPERHGLLVQHPRDSAAVADPALPVPRRSGESRGQDSRTGYAAALRDEEETPRRGNGHVDDHHHGHRRTSDTRATVSIQTRHNCSPLCSLNCYTTSSFYILFFTIQFVSQRACSYGNLPFLLTPPRRPWHVSSFNSVCPGRADPAEAVWRPDVQAEGGRPRTLLFNAISILLRIPIQRTPSVRSWPQAHRFPILLLPACKSQTDREQRTVRGWNG